MNKPKPKHIHLLENNGFSWYNVTNNSINEINWLKNNLHFNNLELKDCLPPNQRPKLVERENYLFLVLLFPVYHRESREIRPVEIDLFISKNFLVTVHNNELPSIKKLFDETRENPEYYDQLLSGGPANIIYEVLNDLVDYCFPMLVHINNDIDIVSSQVFKKENQKIQTIYEVAIIKQNIINFSKAIQGHKKIIKQLIDKTDRFFPNLKLNLYFENLITKIEEIWDLLSTNRETINSIHELKISLSSYRLNQIIKILTIISVIFMPINLIAFLFGMKTNYHPIVGQPYDFWIILGLMALVASFLILVFKKKRWW